MKKLALLSYVLLMAFSPIVVGVAEESGSRSLVKGRDGTGEKTGRIRVPIWWQFRTEPEKLAKDSVVPPWTEVFLVIGSTPEERLRIGRYMGNPNIHETLEGPHLPKEARDAILSCWTWYAGGGDELFVFQKGRTLMVKWRPLDEQMNGPARLKLIKTKKLGPDVKLEAKK